MTNQFLLDKNRKKETFDRIKVIMFEDKKRHIIPLNWKGTQSTLFKSGSLLSFLQ